MRTAIVLTTLLLSLPATLPGQAVPLGAGDRVKVTTGGQTIIYTLVEVAPGHLLVRAAEAAEPTRIDRSGIGRIAVDRGPRSRWAGARRGGVIGAAIGGVGGALVGLASGDDRCGSGEWCILEFTAEEKAVMGLVFFGGLGGIAGGVIGAIAPGHRWEKLEMPVDVTVSPASGGLALGAAVRF